ncbi:Uncharacterised protein [Haemophilus parahaemolyticus]|uniref:Lipoprotein n=1 Tax=Haemophilus parahaemolyticus TaxID=735 RepID=A0A377I3F6_HAEPH|nr:hypothetical protein [Haemophilus parahaemolyticus]STO64994.1 Uncharacterised protein [Haemophilus parahaemolyticus]
MKKILVLVGVGIALLMACDRSIESRLRQNPSDTQLSVTTNAEEKMLQAVEKSEEDAKSQKDLLSEETKGIEETKPSKEAIHKEIVNESISVNQSISEKEPKKSPIISETNIASVEKPSEIKKENPNKVAQLETKLSVKSEIKSYAKAGAFVQKTELPQNTQKITKQSKKRCCKKENIVKNTQLKDKSQSDKKITDKYIDTTENKENHSVEKISKNNHTGIYENGKLVSNFTKEELRLGAQRPLTKDEIQYYKSLCRYAYMSDQDVIENHCEAKKVRFSSKVYSN